MEAATQQAGQGGQEEQQKLKIDKFADGNIVCLKFEGSIDEDFEGKKLATTVKAQTLVLDLANIRKISSFGIREWVDFIHAVEKNSEEVVLLECAPKVVDQLNMVANFAGEKGQVFSFYAPYRCDYCDTDSSVLMQVDSDWEVIKSMKPPERPCGACGEPEYFDEDPTTYFSHIAGQDKFELDPEVGAFLSSKLNYTVSESARRLRMDKIIEGRSTYLKLAGNLDGTFPREKLAEGMEGTIIIDVGGMGKIDPAGAAEWRGFLQMITPGAESIYLVGVPPGFLEKLTKPEDLGAKAQVITFAMPYSCAKCATTASQLVDVEQHFDVLKFATPPEMKCKDCKSPTTCAATEGLLSHLPTLPKPEITPQTRKFIKEVQERKPEKKKQATTVAEAAAAGRGGGVGMMIGAAMVAAVMAVGGIVAYQYINKKKPAGPKDRTQVGKVVNWNDKANNPEGKRPAWIKAPKFLSAGCTTDPKTKNVSCVGVSSYLNSQSDAYKEANLVALEALVNEIGERITAEAWGPVKKIYASRRADQIGRFNAIRDDTDDKKYDRAYNNMRDAHLAVNKAFKKTAPSLYPSKDDGTHWEEYSHSDGSPSKFLSFVRYTRTAAQMQRLVDHYAKTKEVLGATVVNFYPGVAWRYANIQHGAIIVKLGDGDLMKIGVPKRGVVQFVQKKVIDDAKAFVEIVGEEIKVLKERGGELSMQVQRDDTGVAEFSMKLQKAFKDVVKPNIRYRPRGPRTGPRNRPDIWHTENPGGSRDNPDE